MDIGGWLRGLGLERYEHGFRENEIDLRVLPELTADDLKELGVAAIGHRRRLLKAIADLAAERRACHRGRRAGCVPCERPARGRAPAADGDVLRSGRLDGALDALDPEDLREASAPTSAVLPTRSAALMALSPNTWATGCWSISAIPRRMRMTPSGRSAPGWRSIEAVAAGPRNEPLRVRHRHRHRACRCRRSDRRGCGAGARRWSARRPTSPPACRRWPNPGTMVIADATRRQSATLFETAPISDPRLRRFCRAGRAWRGRGSRRTRSRFEASRPG